MFPASLPSQVIFQGGNAGKPESPLLARRRQSGRIGSFQIWPSWLDKSGGNRFRLTLRRRTDGHRIVDRESEAHDNSQRSSAIPYPYYARFDPSDWPISDMIILPGLSFRALQSAPGFCGFLQGGYENTQKLFREAGKNVLPIFAASTTRKPLILHSISALTRGI